MIRSLFKKLAPAERVHHIPPGQRVYAIGDIHGRRDLLEQLMAQIEQDHESRRAAAPILVFLGDFIDRGDDSAGAVALAMELERSAIETHFIAGNHEELLLLARGGDPDAARLFARVGGRDTMLSYGVPPQDYDRADFADLPAMLQAHVPDDHVAFFERMRDSVEIGDYLFAITNPKSSVTGDHADNRGL